MNKNMNLVCPETKQKLTQVKLTNLESSIPKDGRFSPREKGPKPIGRTTNVLVREDLNCVYPIVEGVPILLFPEKLYIGQLVDEVDLSDTRYIECYEEMNHYNSVAINTKKNLYNSESYRILDPILNGDNIDMSKFPFPNEIWIDAKYELYAQRDAYQFITPLKNKRILQLGGIGTHAIKFILAGAKEVCLATPMIEEAMISNTLSKVAGVNEQLKSVVCIGEELPFADNYFDAIYSGSCIHHMVTDLAFIEAKRVLNIGGTFVAADPWQHPFHNIGTKVFGKQDPSVNCHPLNAKRINSFFEIFENSKLEYYGQIFRYPLLALKKLGISPYYKIFNTIYKLEKKIISKLVFLKKIGTFIVLYGKK